MAKHGKTRTKKRKLSAWNLFVKKVHHDNPGKSFKENLILASKMKRAGKMNTKKMM